jgi:hypothetical protein
MEGRLRSEQNRDCQSDSRKEFSPTGGPVTLRVDSERWCEFPVGHAAAASDITSCGEAAVSLCGGCGTAVCDAHEAYCSACGGVNCPDCDHVCNRPVESASHQAA